jgi:hypothetical protein
MQSIRRNHRDSEFAMYILNNGNAYVRMENTVRYVVKKGSMNVKENLQIYPHRKASILIEPQKNEKSSDFFFM